MKKILALAMSIFLCCCDKESSDPVYFEYQLPIGISLNIEENKTVVINDEAAFREALSNYPEAKPVDFNKYTLLLVRGISLYGIDEIKKTISTTNDNKYTFAITITTNLTCVVQPWHLAYVIPKTSSENITLTVDYI